MAAHETSLKKKINIDLIAVTIALTLAALIRLNVLPHISF
jgi:hypothetical protein